MYVASFDARHTEGKINIFDKRRAIPSILFDAKHYVFVLLEYPSETVGENNCKKLNMGNIYL